MAKTFKLVSSFKPSGDQPEAIEKLVSGIKSGKKSQVLLGVTGSGKTFAIANLIEKIQRPTLVLSPNKTLAAQLYAEFKTFFPHNAVEYFISYYDYYQPEAYIPQSDTYIEKDATINDHIDRLRLKATSSLLERKDVIIIASVSCIYNLGSPDEFSNMCVHIEKGKSKSIESLTEELVSIQYERNNIDFSRGKFRVKGDTVEICPAYLETAYRVEFYGDEVEKIKEFDPISGKTIQLMDKALIYPAKHFVMPQSQKEMALESIRAELNARVAQLNSQGKLVEAQRLEQRTRYDMELIKETGFCHGIENYSTHLAGRSPESRPSCLLDYFYKASGGEADFLTIIDESHIGIPQVRGMYEGDRSRKQTLVDYGFRLPSALANRPLKFNEFEDIINDVIFVTATPGPYELQKAKGNIVDLVIRPTGLVDPVVIIRPIENQIEDLKKEIDICVKNKQRVLVNTLTKRLSEDLTQYLKEQGLKVEYLHSEIDSFARIDILKNLRLGKFDVLVGINLLREGLDLPEVALVAILDADKEGFLRSETTLIQICGRAARNIDGKVIFYADNMTGSMKRALAEMDRRRNRQLKYNKENNITPRTIIKKVHDLEEFQNKTKEEGLASFVRESAAEYVGRKNIKSVIDELEKQMREAADNLNFELAAALRDRLLVLKEMKLVSKNNKQKDNIQTINKLQKKN